MWLEHVGELVEVWEERRPSNVLILTHKAADPDALASAIFFKDLISALYGGKALLAFPEGPNMLSKLLLSKLGIHIDYVKDPEGVCVEGLDYVILTDTCSIEQIGEFKRVLQSLPELESTLIVIDHHSPHESLALKARIALIDEKAGSTAEICYKVGKLVGYKPPLYVLELLVAGMVYDTRHFISATPQTFKVMAEMVELGVDYRKVLASLRQPMPLPERIARIKAAQRLQMYRLGKWLVVLTRIGAYEGSVARALLDLGADVVFVASEGDELRVTARAREEFLKETGIHLGDHVMKALGEAIGGSGGGHAAAAGASGRGSAQLALLTCLWMLKEELKRRGALGNGS